MKTFMIVLNTAIVCYYVYLYTTFDPMRVAIDRAVLEVVADLI